jgi:hypothetical protein
MCEACKELDKIEHYEAVRCEGQVSLPPDAGAAASVSR